MPNTKDARLSRWNPSFFQTSRSVTINKASVKGTALFEFLTRSRTDLKSHDSSKCK
jgi:hypothetical protein